MRHDRERLGRPSTSALELDRTLQKAGSQLGDMVQMTVFITDVRYGDRLTEIRRQVFGDDFPGSALITRGEQMFRPEREQHA